MKLKFDKDYFTHNITRWNNILRPFKNKKDLHILEIGCFEGRATLWFLRNLLNDSTSSITVIDTFEGSIEHKDLKVNTFNLLHRFKENIKSYSSKVIILKGYSSLMLRRLKQNVQFDIIYVDGSHIAGDVLEDAVLSWRLLKVGGVLIFDDYEWDMYPQRELCPKIAIDAFLDIYKNQFELLEKSYQVYIKKIRNQALIPDTSSSSTNIKLIDRISKLENDLSKIQNSKTYKIWQAFNRIKKHIFHNQ